jgi:hypothetical protein
MPRAIGGLLVDVVLYGAAMVGVFTSGNPRRIFSHCQLYDFDTHTWHRFADLPGSHGPGKV